QFAASVERLLAENTPNIAKVSDAKNSEALSALSEEYETLRSQMRDRDDFLSLVSHEFRTPLMAVNGYLELLKKHADRLPPEKLQEFIGRSLRATGELTYLADMLMYLVHLETAARRLAIVPVPVAPVAMTAIDQCMALVSGHQITHDIPSCLSVQADEVALQQVLRNLLSNAIKYSPATGPSGNGSAIHFSARSTDGMVTISVRDEGLGMTDEQIAHLFTRFSRVHDTELWPDIHGTGLGLYLCRQIVTSLGGHIAVESTPGLGSTFSVTLPAALASTGEVALALAGGHNG
ncbi:MAG TPA: HAMP domain-containing sensor histidine kinase, partial [Ktedonobacterales bacterium]|nr:HAMP domain-containing sensor histidine kinase [Ktedonobacterales bacterium]